MKLTREVNGYRVIFEPNDWGSGFAKESISLFKEQKGRYNRLERSWDISTNAYGKWKEVFKDEFNIFENSVKYEFKPKGEDEVAYAIGTDENGRVSIFGLIDLKERIDKIEKFIPYLESIKSNEKLLNLYKRNLSQMKKEFGLIVNKPL